MKKLFASALSLAFLIAPVFTGPSHAAKGFSGLSFQSEYFERHPVYVNAFKPFFDATREKFSGKLSFDYFANTALFPLIESFDAVSDGRVDFGSVRASMLPGKLNLLGVLDTPNMCPTAIVGSLVAYDLIQKFPEIRAEFPSNTINFTTWASAATQIHTRKPVTSLADLAGMKIIVWDSPSLEYMKALGANPIRLNAADTYLAMSKGMAEAVCCPLAPVKALKITEVCKHHLMINLFTSNFIQQAYKPLWDSLPEDMRTWLSEQGGRKLALEVGIALDAGAKADSEWMKSHGHEFRNLTAEDHAALQKIMEPFLENWRSQVIKTFDPARVDEIINYAKERSKFYMEEVNSGKYGDFSI
ncbi:MAG: TRAP transporter substrate-binding protein DctP [Mailhella sp.]|nr:TRAP transporter substrate-binding protein DctP [Mailhella sp.]